MTATDEKLGFHGPTAVRKTMLPYGGEWVGDDGIAAVVGVLCSDWLTTGPKKEHDKESAETKITSLPFSFKMWSIV